MWIDLIDAGDMATAYYISEHNIIHVFKNNVVFLFISRHCMITAATGSLVVSVYMYAFSMLCVLCMHVYVCMFLF